MKTFRTFLMTEAYDRSKTVTNWRDKIEERLKTPIILDNSNSSFSVSLYSPDWHEHLEKWKENPSEYRPHYDTTHPISGVVGIDHSRHRHTDGSGYNLLDINTPMKELDHFRDEREHYHIASANEPEGHSGIVIKGYGHIHRLEPTNHQYESGMSVRDVAHDNFMRDLEGALPHPKYVQAALKMYTNPKGNVGRTEDLLSNVADAFHKYHFIASKGKLDSSAYAVPHYKQDTYKTDIETFQKLDAHIKEKREKGLPVSPEVLSLHHDLKADGKKQEPKHTEFNRFDTFDHLKNVIQDPRYKKVLNPVPKLEDAKEGEDYDVIHNNSEATFYHPKTAHGAWVLAHCPHTGEKASWCTAPDPSNRGAHNYFHNYNADGPLVIVHPKNPSRPGELYQVHTPSNQWMDENDEDVDNHLDSDGNHGDPSISRGRGSGMGLYKFNHHDIADWSAKKIREKENNKIWGDSIAN